MAIEMQKLISEYVRAVRKIYGHHLKQVILYGSYARGDYTKDSDVDLDDAYRKKQEKFL